MAMTSRTRSSCTINAPRFGSRIVSRRLRARGVRIDRIGAARVSAHTSRFGLLVCEIALLYITPSSRAVRCTCYWTPATIVATIWPQSQLTHVMFCEVFPQIEAKLSHGSGR